MRVIHAILISLLLFPHVIKAQTSFDPGEGCLNVVEFAVGPRFGTIGDRLIGANYIHERFTNEQFSIGGGAGYSYHREYQFYAIPVFFSTHYFFYDSRLSPFVNLRAGIYRMLRAENIDTFQKYSIPGKQPGVSLYVSSGAGVKVHLTSRIGIMASVCYEGYLVNSFDNARSAYHARMVPNLGINVGLCFQIHGW